MSNSAYERITQRIVALLEQGTVPWHRPWKVSTGLPHNFVTKKPYRGVNVFVLAACGYESPLWLTYRQASRLGATVRKGEKACPVVFWKKHKVEVEGEKKDRFLLRFYHVFNAAQCDGLKTPSSTPRVESLKSADIVANMPHRPEIRHEGTAALYSPSKDMVCMPERRRFESEDGCFSTLFHELVHLTGHESRLKRPNVINSGGFGTEAYSKEELVAELGASFLCGHAEIVERTVDNSAAYIQSWLSKLKDDRTLIVHAAAQAQRAVDFILGRKPKKVEAV
jgi:antirestriction protein ArdC